jgi:hypothetical protein
VELAYSSAHDLTATHARQLAYRGSCLHRLGDKALKQEREHEASLSSRIITGQIFLLAFF